MIKEKYMEIINREFDSFTRIYLNKGYTFQHYLVTDTIKSLAIEDPDINIQDYEYISEHASLKEDEYYALVNSTKNEE